MTETKKTRPRKPKSAPKADLITLAAQPVAEVAEMVREVVPEPTLTPAFSTNAKPQDAEPFSFSFRDQSETIRDAVREALTVSSHGALEVNDKVIQALHTQSHAVLDLWRTAMDNSRLPGGLDAQTGAARKAFETTSAHWKDVAETTARWMTKSLEPLQAALARQAR